MSATALDLTIKPWVAGLMFAAIMISATFRRRATRRGGRVSRAGEGLALMIALRLAALAFVVGMIVWTFDPRSLAWAAVPLPAWLRFTGIGVAFVALGLQCWMFTSLGHNITDTVTVRRNATLVTHGPYRYIRHPLYAFGSVFFMSLVLATANAGLFVVALLAFQFIGRRTPIEEAQLVARFGDAYRDYMERTPRYWPRLHPKPPPRREAP